MTCRRRITYRRQIRPATRTVGASMLAALSGTFLPQLRLLLPLAALARPRVAVATAATLAALPHLPRRVARIVHHASPRPRECLTGAVQLTGSALRRMCRHILHLTYQSRCRYVPPRMPPRLLGLRDD